MVADLPVSRGAMTTRDIDQTSFPVSGDAHARPRTMRPWRPVAPVPDLPASSYMGYHLGYVRTDHTPQYEPRFPPLPPRALPLGALDGKKLRIAARGASELCVPPGWHDKHAVLTVLTLGLWAPIWWIMYLRARRPVAEVYKYKRHRR